MEWAFVGAAIVTFFAAIAVLVSIMVLFPITRWIILGLGIGAVIVILFSIRIGGVEMIGAGIVLGIIAIVAIAVLIAGLRIVQQQERWVIERFGEYNRTLKPGLRWIIPGIDKMRAVLNVWEMTIPLFEKPIKIDFRDGSATPQNAEAFVKVYKPDDPYNLLQNEESVTGVFRAIYYVRDWRSLITDQLENALRSALNTMSIDEGITAAQAGYDLTKKDKASNKDRIPRNELTSLRRTLRTWGFQLLRVTVGDFDLPPELVKARGEVQRRAREADAAVFVRQTRARETMGALVQMVAESTGRDFEDVQAEILANTGLQERLRHFAEEIVTRRMSIDGKALTDIRVGGGGDLESVLLRLIALATRGRAAVREEKGQDRRRAQEEDWTDEEGDEGA